MTASERIYTAIAGGKPDRVPVVPKIWVDLGSRLTGMPLTQVISDPFSALAIAASAVSNAKSLIMAGRDATSAMSQFAGAVSDVNYAAEKAKNPGIFASFSGSAEQAAVDAFSAQKKVQAMRKEIEMLIYMAIVQNLKLIKTKELSKL